jgi:hypothetical protein
LAYAALSQARVGVKETEVAPLSGDLRIGVDGGLIFTQSQSAVFFAQPQINVKEPRTVKNKIFEALKYIS